MRDSRIICSIDIGVPMQIRREQRDLYNATRREIVDCSSVRWNFTLQISFRSSRSDLRQPTVNVFLHTNETTWSEARSIFDLLIVRYFR